MNLPLNKYSNEFISNQKLTTKVPGSDAYLNGNGETNDIDVDLFEDDEDFRSNEAKILEAKGHILINQDDPGVETVEISQNTVNPNNKVDSEDFKILKTIGKGGYGTVFLVQKVKPPKLNELFAMKVLKKAKILCSEKDTAHTVSERNILQMLRHPFLVKLYYAFQSHSYLYIVLEYCPGGELFNYLEKIVYLKEDSACFYCSEIALAIGHLHSLGIIYRDLKSENILLDKDGHVKLTDFGLSKEGTPTTNTFCGTIEYMAPEIIRCSGHGKEVDWWSLGTLLFDMLSGGPPFYQDSNKSDTAQNILHANIKFPESFSPEVVSLIRGLLTRDPKRRLGSSRDVEDIKEHDFFKKNNINWDDVYNRKMQPPFRPLLSSETDVSMFDQNFTSMKPIVSPPDIKTNVPQDLFQGFSYVANSVCEPYMWQSDGYNTLRSDRRKLLVNSKLNGIQHMNGCGNFSYSPRLSRIAQEPSISQDSDSSRKSEIPSIKPSSCVTEAVQVEKGSDCLLMDMHTMHRSCNSLDSDEFPGAKNIPTRNTNLASSVVQTQDVKQIQLAHQPLPTLSPSITTNEQMSSNHMQENGSHKPSANVNCSLM